MYKWNVEQALAMIARERINGLTLVPALAWQLADALAGSGGDVSSVDAVGYGGAAAAPDPAQGLRRTFPNALPGQGYGPTATSALVAANSHEDLMAATDTRGPCVPPCARQEEGAVGEE